MAKVKVLADRISISSEILTDETLEKVLALAPATLKLVDEDGELLFQVAKGDCNTFSRYGAIFKGGKTLGMIPEEILSIEDKETRESKVCNLITAILTKINVIEEAVDNCELPDYANDIEFLD